MARVGTVIENEKWKVKVYGPPREHGPPHVHVIAKGEGLEVKISLGTLEVMGETRFSKRTVRGIIRYLHENYDYLVSCWEVLHGENEKAQSKGSSEES